MAPLLYGDDVESFSDTSASESNNEVPQQRSRKRRKLSPLSAESSSEAEHLPSKATAMPAVSRVKSKGTQQSAPSTNKVYNQPGVDVPITNASFATLNIAPWLVASLSSMAIKRPTGIQRACIPEILKGRDCIGGSRTGSGKTVAFAVPILQLWAEDPVGIFAVILTPTRYASLFFAKKPLA